MTALLILLKAELFLFSFDFALSAHTFQVAFKVYPKTTAQYHLIFFRERNKAITENIY
jgi:hypothetical protein